MVDVCTESSLSVPEVHSGKMGCEIGIIWFRNDFRSCVMRLYGNTPFCSAYIQYRGQAMEIPLMNF